MKVQGRRRESIVLVGLRVGSIGRMTMRFQATLRYAGCPKYILSVHKAQTIEKNEQNTVQSVRVNETKPRTWHCNF